MGRLRDLFLVSGRIRDAPQTSIITAPDSHESSKRDEMSLLEWRGMDSSHPDMHGRVLSLRMAGLQE
jgi:hypothetical protein